jgi:hypothetical protein
VEKIRNEIMLQSIQADSKDQVVDTIKQIIKKRTIKADERLAEMH